MTRRRKLSAAFVKQVREAGKYYDEHGLFLRVEKSGSKRWVQRTTINGRQREIGLGAADIVGLAEVREQAFENRKLARSGGDPLAAKQAAIEMPTFDVAFEQVIELYSPTWSNAKHESQFRNTLKAYASTYFGNNLVSEVSTADILRALTAIWTSKPETARRVKQRISTVMKWSVAKGYRPDDPTQSLNQALPKNPNKQKHRKSIHYDQVNYCIKSVRQSNAMLSTKMALEFLILTATRSGEVRLATWDEVNFNSCIWTIPAQRMKSKEEHIIPLADRPMEILEYMKGLGLSKRLIFQGSKLNRPISDMTMSKLVKELGFESDVHGFRTSFRVWVQEKTNTAFDVAEKALAHKTKNRVVAAYARSDLFDKRRKLMNNWAKFLSNDTAKIIPLVMTK